MKYEINALQRKIKRLLHEGQLQVAIHFSKTELWAA